MQYSRSRVEQESQFEAIAVVHTWMRKVPVENGKGRKNQDLRESTRLSHRCMG
jgi:hypothetical protein